MVHTCPWSVQVQLHLPFNLVCNLSKPVAMCRSQKWSRAMRTRRIDSSRAQPLPAAIHPLHMHCPQGLQVTLNFVSVVLTGFVSHS